MEHELSTVKMLDVEIRCMPKLIGSDLFRYFVPHLSMSFASIGKPNESGDHIAITCGDSKNFGKEFTHEEVLKWVFETLRKNNHLWYEQVLGKE